MAEPVAFWLMRESPRCQQAWLTLLPFITNTKLISSLCRPTELGGQPQKHSSAELVGFSFNDAIVDFNKHSCKWAETKSWISRKWLNNHLSAVCGKWAQTCQPERTGVRFTLEMRMFVFAYRHNWHSHMLALSLIKMVPNGSLFLCLFVPENLH